MLNMVNIGRNLLFAMALMAFVIPTASAGLIEVYINNSEDLVTSENPFSIKQGQDFTITFNARGVYRNDENLEEYDEEFAIYGINFDVEFLNDDDMRETCTMCAIPEYKSWKNSGSGEDPGYDTYEARFYGDNAIFEDYSGDLQFIIVFTNRTGVIVWSDVLDIQMTAASSSDSDGSSGFSLPGLPPVIEENFIVIAGGLLGIVILSFLIYTFVLAPEDTTADLFKERESIDPLSKSLTGVGYDSDLPGEEDDEEDEEEEEGLLDDDEEEEEFDESKLLAELTSSQTLKSSDDEEEEEEEPEKVAKKPAKKKIVKKAVKKKVVRKAAPPKDVPKKPEVNMGEGIVSITCPSCEKLHNVDEETSKFICGCGRRIRV